MKDTLAILKSLGSDPVPYVNTTVLFGLSAMQWDLMIKILVAVPSIIWTYFRIINEIKKYRGMKSSENDQL